MQVKVNIELQGDSQEVGLVLGLFAETLAEEAEEEAIDSTWWTPDNATAFVRELTDIALQALSVVASRAPKVTFLDLQREMGLPGLKLAGRLSSIGFAVSRLGAPLPFVRDYYQRVYLMDEEVAKVLKQAIVKEQARRRALVSPK